MVLTRGLFFPHYVTPPLGGGCIAAVNLANGSTNPLDAVGQAYCKICNFASYASSIMGDPAQRSAHIQDITDFFASVMSGTLPSVSQCTVSPSSSPPAGIRSGSPLLPAICNNSLSLSSRRSRRTVTSAVTRSPYL